MGSIARINARYAPVDRSHIPGFPNPMPRGNWLTYLPILTDEKGFLVVGSGILREDYWHFL